MGRVCYVVRWSGKQKLDGKEGGREPWDSENSKQKHSKYKDPDAGLSSGLSRNSQEPSMSETQ